jgi:glucuronoarabinoxylan endo-1,4-beta-xylanase
MRAETNLKKARQFSQLDMHHRNVTFRRNSSKEGNRIQLKKWLTLAFLFIGPVCYAQSATINWTNAHQVIDGFGAADANEAGTNQELTPSQLSFFFGTGSGQLGFTILRTNIPNDFGTGAGNCATVNAGCVGLLTTDYAYAVSNGVRIYSSSWSPPAAYKTNGSVQCGSLAAASYANFATWISNFVQSWKTYQGVAPFAISVQNEPDECGAFTSASWTSAQLDSFIKNNLGPAFSSAGLSTLIFQTEVERYSDLSGFGNACATDPSCSGFLGGINFHDYDASVTGTDIVNAATYPSGWPPVSHYWETEVSCPGQINFCVDAFDPSITNAMNYAAVIDQRLAVDNVNAYLWWWFLQKSNDPNGEGLMGYDNGQVAPRAYVLGQYARFIRPGYVRIDATHKPQSGVSVSAYQNTSGGNLTVVATNYTASPIVQAFNITNAPNFTSVTPYITSATQNIQAQSAQSVSGNSFTYTLPADSVTTFVGASSSSTVPAPPSNLRSVVN